MSAMTSLIGYELNDVYAEKLNGVNTDGFGDHGIDVRLSDGFGFQVKSSLTGVIEFLSKAVKEHWRYIPIALGSPGTPEETEKALREKGVWVGLDIENREDVLAQIIRAKLVVEHIHRESVAA
ncbi:hypothetical protein CL614_00750 [archaeon]|nr:hypothetical protein [archaeon]|tara:strand:+ start:17 stop:385 length:369 start_codon:yes stop_codon:yes gene_type:complete